MVRFLAWLCTSTLVATGLAACGGGGGGSSGAQATPALVLSYATPVTATVGQALGTLSPTITGTATSYSVSPALPAGLSLNTTNGQISGTPTAASAAANYTITATNGAASTAFALNLTVRAAAPTSLSYASPQAYVVGVAITALNPTVTGTVTGYSISPALPAGLSLNATSGQITGTPTIAGGSANYTITASNGTGSTTATLAIAVNLPPAPTLSFAPARVNSAVAVTLNWTTTNATGCTASGDWTGAKTVSGSASQSWPAAGRQVFTLTCQNSAGVTTSASVAVTPKLALGLLSTETVSGAAPTNIKVGLGQFVDLDGNGWDDYFVTGAYYPFEGSNPVARAGYVILAGASGFSAATQFPYASMQNVHAREFAFADFNGDGMKDVFIADHGYDAGLFPGYQNSLYLSNAGAASWQNATANLPQVSDFTHSVTTGDVNNDGNLDIFAGNGGLTAAYFSIGDGHGGFTRNSAILPINSGQALENAGVGLTSSLLADLNGDGFPELILGTGYLSRATQVLWNSGGSYAGGTVTALPAPANYGTSWSIYDVAATELNGDGNLDLILDYQTDLPTGGWRLQFLINGGNGTFTDQTSTYLADAAAVTSGAPVVGVSHSWIQFLMPKDLNGDGRSDFWVDPHAWNTPNIEDACPVALIRQADGSFNVIKVSDLRAAGLPDFLLTGFQYAARGAAQPGSLLAPFIDGTGRWQVNSQVIAFR